MVISMIENVVTKDIPVWKWREKVRSSDMKWLTMQYRGLSYLLHKMDDDIEIKTSLMKNNYGGFIPDKLYKENIYPLEDELLNIGVQLVDVEDELERRGVVIK